MDILRIFKLHTNEYNVLIQGTIDKPLFLASDIAKIFEIKNIRSTIQDYTDKERGLYPIKTVQGLQNALFLTERGLYKLIARSNKKIATTFQDWIFDIVEEIRKNGRYELSTNNEIDQELIKKIEEQKNHEALIESFDKLNVVYLGKVGKDDDGSFYVKIGWSDDIKTRSSSLLKKFGEFTILKLIKCNNNKNFEQFLHNHKEISKLNVKNFKNTNSQEVFKFNDETYTKLLNIIQQNQHKYRYLDGENTYMIELKKLELQEEENKRDHILKEKIIDLEIKKIDYLLNTSSEQKDIPLPLILPSDSDNSLNSEKEYVNEDVKYDMNSENIKDSFFSKNYMDNSLDSTNEDIKEDMNIENIKNSLFSKTYMDNSLDSTNEDAKEDMNIENIQALLFSKNYTNTKSPKVQLYDPETLAYIKTFDSIIETVRSFRDEHKIDNFSDATLRAASKGNYVYCGYRWNLINRDVEDKPYDIPPTEVIWSSRRDIVARLNIHKNKILEVYSSQKDAANDMNLKSPASLCNALKRDSICQGHYWKFYDDCSEELKDSFIQNGGVIPDVEKNISGSKAIQQIHPFTKEILATYTTIKEVQLKFKMSRDSLKKAIANKSTHNGFYWAYAS